MKHLRLALWLGLAGAISVALVFPYVLELMPSAAARVAQAGVALPMVIVAQVVQGFVLLTLMSWAGLRVGERMGLDAPILRAWVYGTPRPRADAGTFALACGIGLVCAMLIVIIAQALQPWMPPSLPGSPPRIDGWKGLLASFYGAIGEELQLRLFAMTLLMGLAWKAFARGRSKPPAFAAWTGIALASLLFAAGHLPAAAGVWPLDTAVVLRTLSLNAIAGIAFGWLFWRHGLEQAMAAHFTADLVLHVAAA